MSDTDEKTPVETPRTMQEILLSVEKIVASTEEKVASAEACAKRAADASMQTNSELRGIRETQRAHARRIRRLELRDLWLPTIMACAALVLAVVALVRGQAHVP